MDRTPVFAIAILGLLLGSPAHSTHDSNCDGSTVNAPIHCAEEDATSTNNININASSIDIDTTGLNEVGVHAVHAGEGNININITGTTTLPSTIDTTGAGSHGIEYFLSKEGVNSAATLTLSNTQINTQGSSADGILANSRALGDLKVDLNEGIVIETSADGVSMEHGWGAATGNLIIEAQGVRITTRGDGNGFWARQYGNGEIRMDIRDSTIATQGNSAYGMYGYRPDSSGDIDIDVTGGSTTTGGYTAFGIVMNHKDLGGGDVDTGNIEITTRNHTIETAGTAHYSPNQGTHSYGIYATNENTGNIDIDLGERSRVITRGEKSHGIVAYQRHTTNPGSIDIDLHPSTLIITYGPDTRGIQVGTISGGVPIRMASLDAEGYRQQTVTVNGGITSTKEAIFLANGGRVIFGPLAHIQSTPGIAILATGTVPAVEDDPATMNVNEAMPAILPKLRVDLNLNGQAQVASVLGSNWIINDGGETTIALNGTVLHDGKTGVTNSTAPNGAWNVTMLSAGQTIVSRSPWTVSSRASDVILDRDFSIADFSGDGPPPTVQPVSPPPRPPVSPRPPIISQPPSDPEPEEDPEPEPQVYRVEAARSVSSDEAAGIQVEGDGEVHIEAQGSIRAASGIAILATGENPDLLVDIDLDGRSVMEVIGDDWIINDGGGTTIVVNDEKLHDADTGVVPDASAPNGARDVRAETGSVRVREQGVRVTDYSDPDPANWVITEPAEGVIADRDFSVADFIETEAEVEGEVEVEPEPEPELEPEPMRPVFVEEYAPRAALYEALPDVLLGLHGRTASAPRTAPAWFTVTGHTGKHEFDRSTVGIEYDLDYVEVEAGKHVPLQGDYDAWAAVHYLDGTADVSSPVQGGDIDVQGLGLSLELCHGCENGEVYFQGQLALTRYEIDLESDTRGRLKSGVNANAWALHLEAGRHLQRGNVQLSPRIRLDHASVSVDRFTDAVNARVSYADEDRTAVALGLLTETGNEDGLLLWGSLDFEHILGNAQTVARVSGERLGARSDTEHLLIGAGVHLQRGNLGIDAGLSAREALGSGSEDYSASLNLGLQF